MTELWTVHVDECSDVEHYRNLLSSDELERAQRFIFEKDRKAFTVARGALRTLLGRYLGQDAHAIAFTYGPHGKPSVAGSDLHFNVSHSGEMAVYGFSWAGDVGVDVERMREIEFDSVAKRFFAPEEVSAVLAHGAPSKKTAFFHCWTRKEAFIKADGTGLSLGLKEFAVSVPPDDPVRLLRWKQSRPVSWHSWEPRAGYVAAACVLGEEEFVVREFGVTP